MAFEDIIEKLKTDPKYLLAHLDFRNEELISTYLKMEDFYNSKIYGHYRILYWNNNNWYVVPIQESKKEYNLIENQELKQEIFKLKNYISILEKANDIEQELNKTLREENERLRFKK